MCRFLATSGNAGAPLTNTCFFLSCLCKAVVFSAGKEGKGKPQAAAVGESHKAQFVQNCANLMEILGIWVAIPVGQRGSTVNPADVPKPPWEAALYFCPNL